MSHPQYYVQQAIQSLLDNGKSISVGQVRRQLQHPVPLPLIINEIERYKSGHFKAPEVHHEPLAASDDETASSELAVLREQVAQLTRRVSELEQQLTHIKNI